MESVTLPAAFAAGLLSFVSPCVLPLVPAYLSFMTGTQLEELRDGKGSTARLLLTSVLFVAGFGVVFVALGAGASALGQGLYSARETLTRIGGVVIVILGMHLTGIARIKWLDFEQRVHMKKMRFGLFGAFLLGFFFAFGWSPCVGPILGPILGIAATEGSVTKGMFLLTVYTLGLGIPFILTALFVNGFFRVFGKIKKHMMVIEAIAGVLVIAIGMIMVLDAFGTLQAWFDKIV